MAVLQETKWFGEAVYSVGESGMLTAGRAVPGMRVINQRGEGVAIVMSGPAIGTWKSGGSHWRATFSPHRQRACGRQRAICSHRLVKRHKYTDHEY